MPPCSVRLFAKLAVLSCVVCPGARLASRACADEAQAKVRSAVIQLANDDFLAGELVDSPERGSLSWKSAAFVEPFRFPVQAVQAVRFIVPDKLPQVEGDYCFELSGGDMVFGSLVSLDDDGAVLEVAGVGLLHIKRSVLLRMVRRNKSELIFSGPGGLEGWQTVGGRDGWHADAGHLTADKSGAAIGRDFEVPPLARFEIELSWNKKADFEVSFGLTPKGKSTLRAFHLEVWDNQLVAVRETEREADVAALAEIKPGPGRIALQLFVDQEQGRMLIFSASGQEIGELNVATKKPQPRGGLHIINRQGDLTLENLRIGRWNGAAPHVVEGNKASILASDGAITYGHLKSYDRARHEFVVAAQTERTLKEDEIQDVFFSPAGDALPARPLRVALLSGMRVSGELIKVERQQIFLKCPGFQEPISLPIAALQALAVSERKADPPELSGREGRLEIDGTVLHGCLTDTIEADGSCLVWQPVHSTTASRLARDVSARVVYRDPPPAAKRLPAQSAPVVRRFAFGEAVLRQLQGSATARRAPATAKPKVVIPVLHLRSGDTIPCNVTHIDEKGITIETPLADATFVPHERIKALELMPEVNAAQIARPKKERLLTLPRMQRDNPPTQLIRSADGDYVRGRLVEMDEKQLLVEIRLETKTLPRDKVARIIWLHADEIDSASPPASSGAALAGTRVQAIPSAGNRLTFFAERLNGSTLSGRSELLGPCRVDLKEMDQLLVGAAIEQAALTLAFHQWRLKAAQDPLAEKENGEGEGEEGLESALVGKPAPDFELNLLEGKKFHLADHRDKVLVLDFWASWCGPCLQVMPQVDKVAREFADQDVKLVAINLEEAPERVKAALERLALTMTVALDRDGRVAEKYGATSIPQTVIIGRDGKVARLFVGGGARFDEQLRAALKSILENGAEKAN